MDFVGRENEMETLRKAWRDATAQQQVVMLIGEPRLGKTRIAQEFYAWLNKNADPANYWPDTLESSHDSLHVNPNFAYYANENATLPWLWWGLRWNDPKSRNPKEVPPCVALTAAEYLRPHLDLIRKREKAAHAWQNLGVGVVKSVLNVASSGLAHPLFEIGERSEEFFHAITHRAPKPNSIRGIAGELADTSLDKLLDLMLALVSSDAVVKGGLPLILILDDVQWADVDSLRFVQRLLRECAYRSVEKHPRPRLLVIATVWEREWNHMSHAPLSRSADSEPVSFSEVLRNVLGQEDSYAAQDWHSLLITECRLARMAEALHPNIRAELPGLTTAQVALVAERSAGVPGYLEQLLYMLKEDSKHLFEQNNPAHKLTSSGERSLRTMEIEYHALARKRLAALDAAEGAVLRLASYVGLTYSKAFVADLAACSAGECPDFAKPEGVDAALKHADHPLAIVQAIAERLDEFRLPIYREVLRRQLDESEGLRQCVDEHVPKLLQQWMQPQKLATLSREERSAFLSFAASEMEPRLATDAGARLSLLRALAEQISELLEDGRPQPLRGLIERWFSLWRGGDKKLVLEVGYYNIYPLIRATLFVDMVNDAAQFAEACINAMPMPPRSEEAFRLVCSAHHLAGEAALTADRTDVAFAHFEASLDSAQQALDQYGPNAARLLNVASSQERVAHVLNKRDQNAAALDLHRQALQTFKRIVQEFGADDLRLRNVSISQIQVADVLRLQDRDKEALVLYRESLQTFERIVQEYGVNVLRLHDISTSQSRVALVLQLHDQNDEALALYRESLKTDEHIVQAFGGNAERLRAVTLAQGAVADMLRLQDRNNEALELFQAALKTKRRILDEFGVNAERLRDVSVSLERVASLLELQDRNDAAIELHRESLHTRERILREFGTNAERLTDVSQSRVSMADALRERDENAAALELYSEALKTFERIICEFGATASRLSDVARSQSRIAKQLLLQDKYEEALKLYRESLQTRERIIREFGANAERLRDVSSSQLAIGDVLRLQDEDELALESYRGALQTCERIVQEFGPNTARLNNLAASKERVADQLLLQDRNDEAFDLYSKSLQIQERILCEFGPTAARLRHVSIAQDKVADVLRLQEKDDDALKLYRKSLQNHERIVRDFDPNAERLRDLSVSQLRVANMLARKSEVDEALPLYLASLQTCERIVQDFGVNSGRLLDVCMAQTNVANVLSLKGDKEAALQLYSKALQVSERVVREFGPNAERLRGLALTQSNLAVLLCRDKMDEAIILFRESNEIRGRIVRDFGANAQRLRDWARSKATLGLALATKDEVEKGLSLCREALSDFEKILEIYGPNEERHQDIKLCKAEIDWVSQQQKPNDKNENFLWRWFRRL